MNILIVLAHPEKTSFTASLARIAKDQFEKQGDEVQFTDLYREDWKSTLDMNDFPLYDKFQAFNVFLASKQAYEKDAFSVDVKTEHEKLAWADGLIFVFPFWWFSMPAILKGWVDRVLSYGIGYGRGKHDETRYGDRYGEGLFQGKRAMVITAIGGKEVFYCSRGVNGHIEDLLFPINHGIFFYAGYSVLPPFIVFDTNALEKKRFDEHEKALRDKIKEFKNIRPIAFRLQNGGDYAFPYLQLKEEFAPGQEGLKIHIAEKNIEDSK